MVAGSCMRRSIVEDNLSEWSNSWGQVTLVDVMLLAFGGVGASGVSDAPGSEQYLSARPSTFVTRLTECDVDGQVSGGLSQDMLSIDHLNGRNTN
jgi:hypothetical protein